MTNDRFAELAHDLKNATAVVCLAASQLINSAKEIDETQREIKDILSRQIERLCRIIDAALDKSKSVGADSPVCIRGLLQGFHHDHAHLCSGRLFEFAIDPTLDGRRILLRRTDIDRLLLNLVSNSAKHTKPGDWIRIGAGFRADRPELWVADSGSGISVEDQARIFYPGFTDSLALNGTRAHGLGLNAVKRIADEHNAEILIESELGAGATFRVVFPEWRLVQPPPA
jgi:signal transduction histidine kinase